MEPYWIDLDRVPRCVAELAATPPMQRLKRVGMDCGCEYTDFPRFRNLIPYSRYEHSLGVALLVWRFTGSLRESAAGLLHDVATPVFAHTVDFLNGDYLTQESTEAGTEAIIRGSEEILAVLRRFGLTADEVKDYHRYPVADNDSPRLSCDRLEYTLGNLVNFGLRSRETVRAYLEDLILAENEDGLPEPAFRSPEAANAFALDALSCARVYVAPEDRYAMQRLAEILREALTRGVLTRGDLYGTEPEVIGKLMESETLRARWLRFRSLRRMLPEAEAAASPDGRRIPAKRRFIDPIAAGRGRLSGWDEGFRQEKDAFLSLDLDAVICGTD